MRHPLFEAVRERFQRICGYCGVTEITVGGELTLDHYRPRAAGGSDDQDNLIYAKIHLLEQQNAELQRTISAQESYLLLLKAQTTGPKPSA